MGHVIGKRELEVEELSKYLYTCMIVSNNKKLFLKKPIHFNIPYLLSKKKKRNKPTSFCSLVQWIVNGFCLLSH